MRAYRWGDDDRYWGPFTYSPKGKSYNPLAFILKSSGDEDGDNGCALRVGVLGRSLILALPPIIKPWREKVYAQTWDAATVARLGRDWYWNTHPREFGWSYSEGHLSIKYGRSTHDSSTDMTWGCFLPWTQWRHVRRSLYDLEGKHFWSELDSETELYRRANKLGRSDLWRSRFDLVRKWEEMSPKATFRFRDFDDQELEAVTHIEEREWLFGTGWFKWLSLFRKPKIRRTLSINFSGETGPEKGSWKGGTCGTGIDMLPGELHEDAFRRYCDEEHRSKYRKYSVKFVARAA